jgi:ligand-binding sensor domain-containing protein
VIFIFVLKSVSSPNLTPFPLDTVYRFVVAVLCSAAFFASAQKPVMKHYGISEGLPSSECYWVIQDSKGYLWIATDAGAVKYDGYKFITYNSAKGLPDNVVFKIHEDRKGRIWFSTYSGKMAYYSYINDSIYTIPANARLEGQNYSFVSDFTFDEADTLYVSLYGKGHLKIFPPAYSQTQHVRFKKDNFFYAKHIGKNNAVYGSDLPDSISLSFRKPWGDLSQRYALRNLDQEDHKQTEPGISASTFHTHCIVYNDSCLIYAGDFEVISICGTTRTLLYQKEKADTKNHIISIFKDNENRIWINERNKGTVIFKGLDTRRQLYRFLEGLSVSSVCQDSDGGYWLSTLENGIYYMPSLRFNYFDHNTGLASGKVFSIAFVNDDLYFSTAPEMLGCFNTVTGKITGFEKLLFPITYLVSDNSRLLVCNGNSFLMQPPGREKVFASETTTKNVKRYLRVKRAVNYNSDLFLGFTNTEIYLLNKHTGALKEFLVTNLPRVFSVHLQHNTIWIGTKSGLYSYTNKKLRFHGNDTSLLACRVEDMATAGDTLFLATRGYGVLCMFNNKIIRRFTEADGLPSNMTRCVTIGPQGTIWVGTNRGLSRLKRQGNNLMLNSLSVLNGLVSNEVNQVIEHGQKLYVATTGGLQILEISDFYNSGAPIPVYIEALNINNRPVPAKENHQLRYYQNFVSIAYKGISVRSEGQVKYKYRLEGLDTGWTYTKNIYVQYTTLPSGNYRFVVYAINTDGKLSLQPATVSFVIQKPFWNTWWFLSLAAVCSCVTMYGFYKNRVKQIKQREEDKVALSRQITESELKALRAQMNPHFMFNAINSIQNFVLKNDSGSAQKYLTKFARLIRSVLENSRHEYVTLKKETEALRLYMELEALRASFCFDYELILPENIDADRVYIPPMVIQPYIENAILHGITPLEDRKGKLILRFELCGNTLICVIDDNGIGRKKAEEIRLKKQLSHQSMGMSVTQERMEILSQNTHNLKAKVTIHDKVYNHEAVGTTVEICINLRTTLND